MTLRRKLILSFLLVALVTAGSVVIVFRLTSVQEVQSFMLRGTMVEVDELAATLEAYFQEKGGWDQVDSLLPESGRGMGSGMMGGSQRLRVADRTGRVVGGTRGDLGATLSLTERLSAVVLHDARGSVAGYLLVEGGMMGSGPNSAVLLNRLLRASLVGALIGTGLALLAGLGLSYQLLKPVGLLTRAAGKLAKGDLSQRVESKSGDELALLGNTFNQMADSLERAERNRRAMTADIAHELRTPIAVQRAQLEALQDGIYPLTPENLQPMIEQTELLTRLVEDLRTLALADAGELRLKLKPAVLGEVTAAVVERFRPEAENHQVVLHFQDNAGERLPAMLVDAARIEQILNNLISNALRYSPPGGSVQVKLEATPEKATLSVLDSGPGFSEGALNHLFERFYHSGQAHGAETGGTGLGLAIARQLALAHGGDLTARNRPEGGAELTLTLPTHGKQDGG